MRLLFSFLFKVKVLIFVWISGVAKSDARNPHSKWALFSKKISNFTTRRFPLSFFMKKVLISVWISGVAFRDARNPHKNELLTFKKKSKFFFTRVLFSFAFMKKCSFLCGFRGSRKMSPEIHTKTSTYFSKKNSNFYRARFVFFHFLKKCSFLCGFRGSRKATPEIHTKMSTFFQKIPIFRQARRLQLRFRKGTASFSVCIYFLRWQSRREKMLIFFTSFTVPLPGLSVAFFLRDFENGSIRACEIGWGQPMRQPEFVSTGRFKKKDKSAKFAFFFETTMPQR